MTKPRISTDFDGRRTALRDLVKTPTAIENGIRYHHIYKRFRKGIRGVDLIAPLPQRPAPRESADRRAQREIVELRRQSREQRERIAAQRARAQQDAMARIKAEHEAEFSRPLIDASLLSQRDRKLARERIKGVQRWWPMGA